MYTIEEAIHSGFLHAHYSRIKEASLLSELALLRRKAAALDWADLMMDWSSELGMGDSLLVAIEEAIAIEKAKEVSGETPE